VIDFLQANVNKLDQKRRLRFDKMDKIFSDLEVVPLFGDMQVTKKLDFFSEDHSEVHQININVDFFAQITFEHS
jgi:hypothetical protein